MSDGTTYSIDIEAQAIGVGSSVDEVNALADKLDSAGAASTQFDAAIARTQALLAQASDAYESAADAVASGEAKYAQLEMAATRAAKAVEAAALAGAQVGTLQDRAAKAAEAVNNQAAALAAAKANVDALAAAENTEAAAMAAATAAVASAEAKYMQLVTAAGNASNALKRAESAAASQTALRSQADAAAAAVKAEALALDELRAKASNAKSSQDQLAKSLKTLEGAAKGASSSIKAKSANIEEMSALAKGALGPMGGIFEKATLITKGIGSGGMAGAIIAAAAAYVVLTSAVVSGYVALATFAVTSNKKAMESLTKASAKAKENLGKLFSGVRVDQFVAGVERVLDLLDESNVVAKGLGKVLEALLNPLFDQSGAASSAMVALFRGMTLGVLQITIALVKLRNAFGDVVPDALRGKIDGVALAFNAGVVAAYALAAGLVLLTGIFMLLVAAVLVSLAVIFLPFIVLGTAIALAIAYLGDFVAAVKGAASQAIAGLGLLASGGADAAGNLISGLVSGIAGGAGAVYDAIRNLSSGAISTLRRALGIRSPSTVFALQGSYTAEGFVEGIEDAQGDVDAAVGNMVQTPDAAAVGAGGAVAAKGSNTFHITIQAPDGDARSIAAAVEGVLTRILEGDLLQLGASEPEPAT
jgi:trimeric autotransporter adhesin